MPTWGDSEAPKDVLASEYFLKEHLRAPPSLCVKPGIPWIKVPQIVPENRARVLSKFGEHVVSYLSPGES